VGQLSSGLWVQYAFIALALIASVAYMLRKLAPKLAIRCQASLAAALSGSHQPLFMQRLGHSLKPREASGDCGSGCGTCGNSSGSCGRGSTSALDTHQVTRPNGR
jgi:hypothetical protein